MSGIQSTITFISELSVKSITETLPIPSTHFFAQYVDFQKINRPRVNSRQIFF